MAEEPEPEGPPPPLLAPGEWCHALLFAAAVALLLVGGCLSGWRAPAELPAIRPD